MNELENDTSNDTNNNISTAELGVEAKPKLAFIDDEQRILRSMKLLFRKTHDVFITTDPTEYIDYIKNLLQSLTQFLVLKHVILIPNFLHHVPLHLQANQL